MEGDAFSLCFGGRMAKAKVAYGTKASRQDVAKVALDELFAWQGFDAQGVAIGPVFPLKAHVGIRHRHDA